MQPEIKRKWVEALRSGKFRQGRSLLEDEGRYCCLGVLCQIQDPNWQRELGDMDSSDIYQYAAGLTGEHCTVLANMNDGRNCEPRSFDHIAGYIDSML